MKLNINSILILVTMALISQAKSDLIPSEKQALLDFASSIPHGKKLNWSPNTPVCNTWYGVTCTPDATHVFALRLPGLRLIGQIPNNTIGKLQALNTLSLRSNKLSGNLPVEITTLPSLHYLYLQHNEFSGLIPDSISQQLVTLDISFNFFSGKIPPTVQNSTRLIVLQLQQNSLTGPIPNIRSRRLLHFNVSYNHLSGSIPSSLKHFSNSSFVGNLLLCGPPFKPCSGPLPSPPSPSSPPPPPPVFPAPFVSTPPPPKAPEKSGCERVLPFWSVIVIAAVVTL